MDLVQCKIEEYNDGESIYNNTGWKAKREV